MKVEDVMTRDVTVKLLPTYAPCSTQAKCPLRNGTGHRGGPRGSLRLCRSRQRSVRNAASRQCRSVLLPMTSRLLGVSLTAVKRREVDMSQIEETPWKIVEPTAHASRLLDVLERAEVPYELLPHRHTETALAEAQVLHVDPHEVAKTLVLGTSDGLVRVVIPASEQLDLAKVRRALAVTGEVSLLTEAELGRAYTEFELGAVPPFAGSHRDRVLVDRRLCEYEWIVIEAGTHEESLRLRSADLLALTDAQLADVCAS
jgi:Ala-tRNA(Pro) deacylase